MANSPFFSNVYALVRQIPRGKVATYSQIAKLCGSVGASRAVGMALKKNPHAPTVPCHRVVAANGSLCGYSAGGGIKTKRGLLIDEGVVFRGDRVNLQLSQWRGL